MQKKKNNIFLYLAFILFLSIVLVGCSQQPSKLVIYSGKGLKHAVDEIITNFEQKEGISIDVVYAGSKTLLDTIKKTRKGDVFIPGSESFIKEAGELVSRSEFVALHIPTFIVASNKSKELTKFDDLFQPGIRVAVGNKRMAAIGRIAEEILNDSALDNKANTNIVIKASTVNELIQLVANNEVDAALIWKDMMKWDMAEGLTEVSIPASINKHKKIYVSSLSTSTNPSLSDQFLNYASSNEGLLIFEKHGFVK